ncbi:fumarylacetoacetate hydrolase [Nakamurella antarctica]|uniref:Fumarylacetoacetate hydrolase n=1 Tax=Nakamurella antarctica TaxID=1902245 RepID=A0A3G8ZZ62_9ACTN|nr:fumarylacetoacetate hydrolase family protein [Nakamurella antarctica]AZI58841.1 fumarylacetoacetate hydrolase [Nakamurella antarctica]
MLITRYLDRGGKPAVGLHREEGLRPLVGVASIGQLLRMSAADIRSVCTQPAVSPVLEPDFTLLPPIDSLMEVWAAGVTYRRSREARVLESDQSADVYERVYDAERPELFFKSVAWRVTGHGETVSVRQDSAINVPEPELALVLNSRGEIVGYTVCNDVSSRSIEGLNPLYLPQAKVYLGACAVGPAIRPAWEVNDPYRLGIHIRIERAGQTVWEDRANTSGLHRKLGDLAQYLGREDYFPDGVILSTGTSLVPELPFTLEPHDLVRIEIDEVGVLESRVVGGRQHMRWLQESLLDPAVRDCVPEALLGS